MTALTGATNLLKLYCQNGAEAFLRTLCIVRNRGVENMRKMRINQTNYRLYNDKELDLAMCFNTSCLLFICKSCYYEIFLKKKVGNYDTVVTLK